MPVLTALKSQVATLVNNRSQPKVRGSDSVASVRHALTSSCPHSHKLSPNPSCALSGASCCFAFYFLQPHYDRTGSHWVYHLLCWKAERVGGVTHTASQPTDSTPELIELWRVRLFPPQECKHPRTASSQEKAEASCNLSPSRPAQRRRWDTGPAAAWHLCATETPPSIPPSPLPCACSCTICKGRLFLCWELLMKTW